MENDKSARPYRVRHLLLLVFYAVWLSFPVTCRAQDSAKSQYVRQDAKDSVIVFVHGVLGDSRSTWTNARTRAYWPALMKDDPFFKDFDIFVIGYPSSILHSS